MYPEIDRHCPYIDQLSSMLEGDFCRTCKRTVYDLDAMQPNARQVFLDGQEEDVCITYKRQVRPALAAAMIAASIAALPAAAQTAPAPSGETPETATLIVGGTRISRPNLNVTEPIQVLDIHEIRRRERAARRKVWALERVEID